MKIGFYDYNKATVGSDGVIFKDTLKDGSTPTGATDVGTPTWSSDGLVSSATAGVSFATITSANTQLDVEGMFRFMVSKEACSSEPDETPATSGNWVGVGNPAFVLNKVGNASPTRGTHGYNKPYRGTNLIGRLTRDRLYYFGTSKAWEIVDDKVEVIITWDGGGIDVYVDKFKAMSVPWTVARPTRTASRCATFAAHRWVCGCRFPLKNAVSGV